MSRARECFRVVAENPRLYGSVSEGLREERTIQSLYEGASSEERIAVALALRYAKRVTWNERADDVLMSIRKSALANQLDFEVAALSRTVEGAVLIAVRRHKEAVPILTELSRQLVTPDWEFVYSLVQRNIGVANLFLGDYESSGSGSPRSTRGTKAV